MKINVHIENVYVNFPEERLEFDVEDANEVLSGAMESMGIEDVSDDLFSQYLDARRGGGE